MMPSVPKIKVPKPLQPGDTIAIISPAAPTRTPMDAFTQGEAVIRRMGFVPKLMPHAQNTRAYLAGTDAERLADLDAAIMDPSIKAILCARGGYGCTRLLSAITPEHWARWTSVPPKALVGFSDVTALLVAFYQRLGWVGYYGPMLTSNLIHDEPYSEAELRKSLLGQYQPGTTIPNLDTYRCFQPGTVTAPLIGGNLSLLAALCGTPWQPQTRGHVVFIEDWHESDYTLDRQFQQLYQAGVFDDITGLLLCDFSEMTPMTEGTLTDHLYTLTQPLQARGIPVGYGFSVGHGAQTATLPIGVPMHWNAQTGTLSYP